MHDLHGRAILRYCRRHLSSREEAEDATQIVFLNAYRSLEQGVDPRSEQAWLFKIAEHVVMYKRRTVSRRARIEFPSDLGSFANSLEAPPDSTRAELAGLEAALGRIPDAQRRAIVLREWHGLSHREVAAELGITRTAAETLIFRARRRLAAELGESEGTRDRKKTSLLSLLGMKCAAFGSGTKIAAGLILATTVVGSVDNGALLRLSAPQTRPANPRPAVVGLAGRATLAQGSVEAGTRRTGHLPPRPVVHAAVGVISLRGVVPTSPAISYPASPDVAIEPDMPVESPNPVVTDRGTDGVTRDPIALETGDPVVVPPIVPPAVPGPAADPFPLPQAGGDDGGTPAPGPADPREHGVGPKHAPGDPAVPSLPPTASPAAQLALAFRGCGGGERALAAAEPESAGDGTSAEPPHPASDPSTDDATGAAHREGATPATAHTAAPRACINSVPG